MRLENSGRIEKLATGLDNSKTAIHRWFPFYAGFSSSIVEEAIDFFKVANTKSLIFDPFLGSGTTGVSCKKLGVDVVGNEINPFLHKICKIKMSQHTGVDVAGMRQEATKILSEASNGWQNIKIENEHPVLERCYPKDNLKKLIALRRLTSNTDYEKYFFLMLSRCLIPSAQVGINIPYITWSSPKQPKEVFSLFKKYLSMICDDIESLRTSLKTENKAKVFRQDSRNTNNKLSPRSVDMVFTSPPYLNNFDYGEALKVFLYFWKFAHNWNEISKRIRQPSVTSATTHYNIADFCDMSREEILGEEFTDTLPQLSAELVQKAELIRKEMDLRKNSKKTFDLLTLLYFKDMFRVMKELERVVQKDSLSFFVVGDSAPYGVHVLTDVILGEMGLELGFSDYTLHPLRARGLKWTTLTYRHKVMLRESLLILRK